MSPREPGTGGFFGTLFRKVGGEAGKAQSSGSCGQTASKAILITVGLGFALGRSLGWW